MSGCVFCGILDGKLPASMVHEDEVCVAFMDIQPVNPGHVLVVPRTHASSLADLEPTMGGHIFQVAQRLAVALRDVASTPGTGVRCEGVNLFVADGEVAGQEVFHVHLHVIPRFAGDGFGFRFGPGYGVQPPRGELDRLAARIHRELWATA